MKALVYLGSGRLAFQDWPTPAPDDDGVLVRVRACAICGSDVHGYLGHTGRRTPPMVMGHEFSGVVEAAGARVTRWKAGDRVLGMPSIGCGQCEFCRVDRPDLCSQRKVLGVGSTNGAMAEFVAVPARCLVGIPEGVSFAEAALVEPLTVAFHAFRRRPAQVMEDVAIIGCGTIGGLVLQIVRQAGPRRIFVSDALPKRLELARAWGATDVLLAGRQDVAGSILEATGGRGVDVAYEAVGLEETLQTALAATRLGGDVVVIGNIAKMGQLPMQAFVTREQRLFGTYGGTPEYGPALQMIAAGRIDLGPLTRHVWPFARGIEAFERLAAGEPGLSKVILNLAEDL
jgi:L-iditol 2-dehydrogenase